MAEAKTAQRPKVYVDGQAGTTGLRIHALLAGRSDLDLIEVDPGARKDTGARKAMLDAADVAILCLPDDAARQAVALAESPSLRIIDASTAHRVAEGWAYGLPELQPAQRQALRSATRIANPGCYPTGVILLLRPLIDAGLVAADAPIFVHALSGYTGGGKPMIARWEDPQGGLVNLPYEAPYAFDRVHKHVPEMQHYSGLRSPPQFVPAVGPFERGMRIQVPLHKAALAGVDGAALHTALSARYDAEACVEVQPLGAELPSEPITFDPRRCNDTNRVELSVLPHPQGHVTLMAILDNLGKGAAGAAVQTLNLLIGAPETRGLTTITTRAEGRATP